MDFTNARGVACLPELVQKDKKGLWIFGEAESKRRVIMIEKKNGSYGFTLQSYGVRYKHGNRETDFITYVNAVEKDGAAFHSGLREGDVILSINGQNMARVEHKSLVNFIRKCPTHLKMVVVSDERARKVELHMRYVHLQKKLHDKMKELEQLNWKEKEILSGAYRNPCGSPLGAPCLSGATSGCCFCPQKSSSAKHGKDHHNPLDDKEKSKTISTMTGVEMEKDLFLFYESCRKSQSNRELASSQTSATPSSAAATNNNTSDYSSAKKSSRKSSTAIPSSPSNSPIPNSNHINPSNSTNTTTSSNTLEAPLSATARLRSTSPLIKSAIFKTGDASQIPPGIPSHYSASGTNTLPNLGPSSSKNASSSSSTNPDGAGNQSKPKSWDNLMTTKSFGGYGFGFGYGYFPSKHHSHGNHPTNHHVTHPHHHNHHSHCNHSHSSYYYNSNTNPGSQTGKNSTYNPSAPPPGGHITKGSYAEYRHCHVTPFSNSGAYQVVTTGKTIRPGSCESGNPGSSKTLPSMRSTSSATAAANNAANAAPAAAKNNSENFPTMAKMEKTLSDSSLNSDHHKDFPKSMSYYNPSSTENLRYSSEDEYEQYRTEDPGTLPTTGSTKTKKHHNIFV